MFSTTLDENTTIIVDNDVDVIIDGNFINNGTVNNEGYLEVNRLYSGIGIITGAGTFVNNPMGDLNSDGLINVLDVVLLVNSIFDDAPYNQYSDMNNDGEVNVVDVVLLVNIILGEG